MVAFGRGDDGTGGKNTSNLVLELPVDEVDNLVYGDRSQEYIETKSWPLELGDAAAD